MKAVAAAAALAIGLLTAAPAWACPVCFGETEDQVVDGVRWSMVFLGGLVYLLIGGGVATVVVLQRRARRFQDPRRGLYLVDSEPFGPPGSDEEASGRRPRTEDVRWVPG